MEKRLDKILYFLGSVKNLFEIPNNGEAECPMCHKKCRNAFCLNYHVKYFCSKEKSFACPKCDYRCRTKSCLNRHYGSKHMGKPKK